MADLSQKTKLLRGLLEGDFARTGPFFVDVDITRRCNLRCLGCPYHSPHADSTRRSVPSVTDLPINLFKRLCTELKQIGTQEVVLQGMGEPLLHPDICEIIATAKDRGFRVIVLTNGTLLKQGMAERLVDESPDLIKVSLWATSAEQYEQNYPGGDLDSFEAVVSGLKLISRLKAEQKTAFPKVIIYHIINRNNFQTIDAMVDLAFSTECDGLFFSPMHDAGAEVASFLLSGEEEHRVRIKLSQVREQLEYRSLEHNIDSALLRFETKYPLWEKFPCYIAWFHTKVTVDGEVQPCSRCDGNVTFGNLNEGPFYEIWNSPAARAFRRKTFTRKGLAEMSRKCRCSSCCYVLDISRIHRIFRWFRPFAAISWMKD